MKCFPVLLILYALTHASSAFAALYQIRLTSEGDSLLKSEPSAVTAGIEGKDFCALRAGATYEIVGAPQKTGNFLKVELAFPINEGACALDRGYIFAAHVAAVLRLPVDGEATELNTGDLGPAILDVLSKASIAGSLWGVDMRAMGPDGEIVQLFALNETSPLMPASVNKILTTASNMQQFSSARSTRGSLYQRIRSMMKPSDNEAAQSLWVSAGRGAGVENSLQNLGLNFSESWRMIDGSGLSRSNKVTASDMTDLLVVLAKQEYGPVFRSVLPIAGVDGTLGSRLKSVRGRVTAKTGTLSGVYALAGYGDAASGWTLVFTVLGNGLQVSTAGDNSAQSAYLRSVADDAVVKALRYLDAL